MMLSSMPAPVKFETAKWRRSWMRRASTPASFATRRNRFPKIPCVRSFEITFEPRVGLGWEDELVTAVARQSTKCGRQPCPVTEFALLHCSSPAGRECRDSRNLDRCRSICGSGSLLCASQWWARARGMEGGEGALHLPSEG